MADSADPDTLPSGDPPDQPSAGTESLPENPAPAPAQQSPRRWRWHWSLFAACALIGLMAVNRIAIWVYAIADTLGNFSWQLVFLCVALSVYQLIQRRPVWAVVIVILVGVPALRMALLYLPAGQPAAGPRQLQLMTLNVQEPNRNYQSVAELISQRQPDIVTLLEFSPEWEQALTNTLADYRWRSGPVDGVVIFSRLPLEPFRASNRQTEALDHLAVAARMDVDGQPVMLIATHPTSPTTLNRLLDRDAWIGMLAGPAAHISNWRHVIVVGDFNATTHCRCLRFFLSASGLRDSRQGFGLQSSWPTWFWPLAICIDQAFVSEGVHVHRRETGPDVGSDHLPVFLEVSFAPHKRFAQEPAIGEDPRGD